MLSALRIGPRLALAAAIFLLPIGFLLTALTRSHNAEIDFAAREATGAAWLGALSTAQGQAAIAALGGGRVPADVIRAMDAAQMAHAPTLDLQREAAEALAAMRAAEADTAALPVGRAALRGLIVVIGDRSNLILDNVLATYYLTDAVLNRLPDAIDRFTDLALLAGKADSGDRQTQFLIGRGALTGTLEGLSTALDSARRHDAGGEIERAIGPAFTTLGPDMGRLLTGLEKDPGAAIAAAPAMIARIAQFHRVAAEVLERQLRGRVAVLESARLVGWIVALGCAALAFTALLLVAGRGMVRPLGRLSTSLRGMADGDLDNVDLPPAGKDEVGQIAAAARVFHEKLAAAHRAEEAAARDHARRDRRQEAMDRATQDFGASIAGVLVTLGESSESMRQAADKMSAAAERTLSSAGTTADRADGAARDLTAVTAATEELTASASEIARQVTQATDAARAAAEHARATDVRMRELEGAAESIGDVVRLINEIAGQTNLLALNATIEAARAGEAGKGFAVVASEVKQLAAQTAKATEQIGAQIDAIRQMTAQAAGAVGEVGSAIGHVDEIAAAIAAAAEQQSAATREIASSVQAVADSTQEITGAMREVADVATQSGHTGQGVQSSSAEVNRIAGTLRHEVENFLIAMRADDGERRRYERVPGAGCTARLSVADGRESPHVALIDISRGGCALAWEDKRLAPGAEVTVTIEGAGLVGRIVRAAQERCSIAFRQTPENFAKIDAVMDRLSPARAAA